MDLARLAAAAFGRPDLERRQALALEKINRPETIIAVIGEFKQGKSSLVNALLGVDIAPVDDDLATAALTVFRHGEAAQVTVARQLDGEERIEAVPLSSYPGLVVERATSSSPPPAALVEVVFPNEFLAQGATLVDTPGFGGLAVGYAGMTLAYLHRVDAVIFLSDASAPLTQAEVDFLSRAIEACPAVLMGLTKVDIYHEWRRIMEADQAALTGAELELPILPLSNALMHLGHAEGDAGLMAESGVPALREVLDALVFGAARDYACRRGLEATRATLDHLHAGATAELSALEDPEAAAGRQLEFSALQAKLQHLQGPAARWSQMLFDGLGDVVGDAEHRFRSTLRDVSRRLEDDIEGSDPGRDWDRICGTLREQVGAATDTLLREIDDGARRVQGQVASFLRDEDELNLPAGLGVAELDAAGMWPGKGLEKKSLASWADTAFLGLRGGQGGISTFSVIAGLAGVTISTAASAGIGLVFSGKQLLDERRRHLQQRRQQARSLTRQYIDDVQFETGKRVRDISRDLQRGLRDYFSERLEVLHQTCVESLTAVQAATQRDEQSRQRQLVAVRGRLAQLSQVAEAAMLAEASL